MILDRQNMFSWKQALTVSAPSTDTIDLGPNMWTGSSGKDEPLPIIAVVEAALVSAGATTLEIQVQSSNTSDFSGTVITHQSTGAIPKASLGVPGRLTQSLHIPPDVLRYVRLNYIVGTGPFTGGTITAGITASRQLNF